MPVKPSKWEPYKDRIHQILESRGFSVSPSAVANTINEEESLDLGPGEIERLRVYISKTQTKVRKQKGLGSRNTSNVPKLTDAQPPSGKKTWEETKDGAISEYKGEKPITTVEEAVEFFDIDTQIWEAEKITTNSWDVSMKRNDGTSFKRTNYQIKVIWKRIISIEIQKPKPRNIHVKTTKAPQMFVIIGCVHRPFHDKELWDKFLKFLSDNKKQITGIIVNGDFLDLRSMSSHEEYIPNGVDLGVEYSSGLQGIQDIEDSIKKSVRKIFIYGNHEDRFFRDKTSIRKYGSTLKSPHEAMELPERGWEIIEDWKNGFVTLGNNLDVFHGVKVGINAAKDQLNALPTRSHIFNHTHRFGSYSNNKNAAYNIGCMIDFNHEVFKYVDRGVRESWTHGFAVAYIDNKGVHHVRPIKVDNDKTFFFQGKIY